MFTHTVLFWLKHGIPVAEVERFERELRGLLSIPALKHGWVGTPAATRRPVIDHTYSYGLNTVFDSQAEHDAYQVDPVHKQFVESCSNLWDRVQVYDFE